MTFASIVKLFSSTSHNTSLEDRVGELSLFVARSTWCCDWLAVLRQDVIPSIKHGNLLMLMNGDNVCGFVTFARLLPETERRLFDDNSTWLHISEWNEGNSLWLRSSLLRSEALRALLKVLESQPFGLEQSIRHTRIRAGRIEYRELPLRTIKRWADRALRSADPARYYSYQPAGVDANEPWRLRNEIKHI